MKKIIHTQDAPAPIGPYNQAVQSGNMLFVSGQIAIDPSTGEMDDETISIETERVLKNLGAVLEAAGMSFQNVVKTSIFLSDMGNFQEVNAVYSKFFTSDFPARETVAVRELPKSVNVEISAIAVGS